MAELPLLLPAFGMIQPLTGANNSTHYIAVVGYKSLISNQQDMIKTEVGLREPLLTTVHRGSAKTMLLDPVSDRPLLNPASLCCIFWPIERARWPVCTDSFVKGYLWGTLKSRPLLIPSLWPSRTSWTSPKSV
jgi:hypothetical protein